MASHNTSALDKALMGITSAGGNTPLTTALNAASADMASTKGPIALIVVSDGEDYGTVARIAEWIPVLKQSGVVLDYIHIGDCEKNAALAAACTQLGGQFVVVSDEAQLEEKFVEAIKRPMLPPAPDAK